MLQEHSDAIGVAIGKTATFGGGASALFFGLNANEVAAIVGAVVAVIGLSVQVYYNRKRDRRETEYHFVRLLKLRDGEDAEP